MILKVSVIALKITDKFPNMHENQFFFGSMGILWVSNKESKYIQVQQQEIVDCGLFSIVLVSDLLPAMKISIWKIKIQQKYISTTGYEVTNCFKRQDVLLLFLNTVKAAP